MYCSSKERKIPTPPPTSPSIPHLWECGGGGGDGRLNYPSIQIVFDYRDLPFALALQKELINGSIRKQKGANAYILTFNYKESILLIVSLINGMHWVHSKRTPKIEALYRLID